MSKPHHIRVVTFSRQVGAGGESIARATAERLGFRYVDREVIDRASEAAGVTPELVENAEHFPSLKARMLASLTSSQGLMALSWFTPAPYVPNPLYTSERYRALVQDVIKEVAKEGEAVILGHGGQVILRERWDTLRILVTGSDHLRILRVQERMETGDPEPARRHVEQSDQERATYFDHVYGLDWLSPKLYDLCINTDHWSIEEAVGLVVSAACSR